MTTPSARLIVIGRSIHLQLDGQLMKVLVAEQARLLAHYVPALRVSSELHTDRDLGIVQAVRLDGEDKLVIEARVDSDAQEFALEMESLPQVYIDFSEGIYEDNWLAPMSSFDLLQTEPIATPLTVTLYLPPNPDFAAKKEVVFLRDGAMLHSEAINRGESNVVRLDVPDSGTITIRCEEEPKGQQDARDLGCVLIDCAVGNEQHLSLFNISKFYRP